MIVRRATLAIALAAAAALGGCASLGMDGGWTTLIDGDKGLENFNRIGDANWRAEGGAIVADQGKSGFLVTKAAYKDFVIRAEFWAATDTNSGIFLRVSDPNKVGADSSYEVNIWDIRPDPKYGTGGIVDFAAVPVPAIYKAGGKWNVYEIEVRGTELTVTFNGAITAKLSNSKYASGPFALQYGPGVQGVTGGPIMWRKLQVRAL